MMIRSLKLRTPSPEPESKLDLDRAFALCSEITRDHSKSFYFSTAFLPKDKRRAIRAFYAFCRTTDDTVDVLSKSDAEARPFLDEWRRASRLSPSEQVNPVLAAWTSIRDRYAVPQVYVEELIDGCEMDLSIKRYKTWQELERYCYCVASTVGLISMHIIGVNDDDPHLFERSRQSAIDLGIALQLTNILRDVGEDLARGRIYLPQEDLRRFDYTEADLHHGVIDDRFRALMRFEIQRAHDYYARSIPSISALKSDGRVAVAAAAMLYRGILDKIIANDFDVFNKRAHLTFWEKLQHMPGIVWMVRQLPRESKEGRASA
ncbi:MAG: phytoene/squalene synthase family protein [Chloroflexi bacterium]|jgi:phytoene synthase|uniref:Squalene synthase n=2 Tax=Candidatus Thermofonsia Clade 3 TaxID=2364209 RepID=A0A2M8QAC2_9CHLR|nr:MAG: squalene synthase [Candidatus Thermofonsia Clade 3 bacterium]RMG63837.1 MAG: phytoene/squalene synthase family protein [Chloroflexota bacterium]